MTADPAALPLARLTSRGGGSGFARGLLIGTLLGGAVVLIFTPRTGEEVRECVGALAQSLTERVRGALTGDASYLHPTDVTTPPV